MANTFDFSTIIASSVHDLKNSIGMLLGTLDELVVRQQSGTDSIEGHVAQLRGEALRVNNNLIQLLGIYKLGNRQYQLNMEYQSVQEVLYENILLNQDIIESKQLEVELNCDASLCWFFDRGLLAGVINDVVSNAVRYTKKTINVSAVELDGVLRISVSDDGPGFPRAMLISETQGRSGLDFKSGSTGLGLYFSSLVAQQHENNGKKGYIELTNDGMLGGGCFSIYLP